MKLYSKFSDDQLNLQVLCTQQGFRLKGKTGSYLNIRYWAANAADYHLSVAGTALPFANEEVAYDPTCNKGTANSDEYGLFQFDILRPNSYYSCAGRQLVPPHLNLAVDFGQGEEKVYNVPLGPGYQSRSLSALPGRPNRSYDR